MVRLKRKKKRSKKGQQFVSNKNAGRKYQRQMAKRLGGKSVGTIEGQDIEHSVFSVETKKMKALPKELVSEKKVKDRKTKEEKVIIVGHWTQTLRNCPEGKIPVLIMHKTGDRFSNDLVVLKFGDFENLVNPKEMKNVSKKS